MFEGALALLASAEASTPDELQAAHLELLRGQIAFASSLGTTAPSLLLSAAQRLEPLDPELARETYLDAWGAALSPVAWPPPAAWSRCPALPHRLRGRPAHPVHPICCSMPSAPSSPKDVRRPRHC
jgi:hypothetical protein